MHATIERKLVGDIYIPHDYVVVMESARLKPSPYVVKQVSHDEVLKLNEQCTTRKENWRSYSVQPPGPWVPIEWNYQLQVGVVRESNLERVATKNLSSKKAILMEPTFQATAINQAKEVQWSPSYETSGTCLFLTIFHTTMIEQCNIVDFYAK